MNKITIVGMGPGEASFLTVEALELLTHHDNVVLRTDKHPVVSYLVDHGMTYKSFDDVYEAADNFDETYQTIADRVIEMAKLAPVVYAVPGNAFVAEKTVSLLMDKAKDHIDVVHGVSFIDAMISALAFDPVVGLTVLDALNLENEEIIPSKDMIVIQVYNQMVASKVKLLLMEHYDDDHRVKIVRGAGIKSLEVIKEVPLYELDHYPEITDYLTSVFVTHKDRDYTRLFDLTNVMATLRSEEGCPWDREQTHESLTNYLIEEAYEVKHAVEHEDDDAVVDELGDALLQIVFHAQIAAEDGYYDIRDIIKAINTKMIRRHPHVFGTEKVSGSDEVLDNWQKIKDVEKASETLEDSMRSVSFSLPALVRSQKIQKRASKVGFDWPDALTAFEKVSEEVAEVKEALEGQDKAAIKEEIGDLLMIIANVSRHLEIDAEEALQEAIEKFITRFAFVEKKMSDNGLTLKPENISLMENYWTESKKWENSSKNL